jgi:NADH-quinone oxidoreductase subunit N
VALAALSMIYGNVVALQQDDMKRMLAYSGIANTGYAMIALASGGTDSYSAVLFFLVLYTLTNLGAFFVVLALTHHERCMVSDFAGLGRRAPFLAFAMAVFMFSLAGTPPLAGFWGKFGLFLGAVSHGMWLLALVGLLTTVVSLGYYLRVTQQMYRAEGEFAEAPGAAVAGVDVPLPLRAALWLTLTGTLLLGVAGMRLFTGLLG